MLNRKRVLPDDLASAADFFEEPTMESSEKKKSNPGDVFRRLECFIRATHGILVSICMGWAFVAFEFICPHHHFVWLIFGLYLTPLVWFVTHNLLDCT